jgi:hypothetical protein
MEKHLSAPLTRDTDINCAFEAARRCAYMTSGFLAFFIPESPENASVAANVLLKLPDYYREAMDKIRIVSDRLVMTRRPGDLVDGYMAGPGKTAHHVAAAMADSVHHLVMLVLDLPQDMVKAPDRSEVASRLEEHFWDLKEHLQRWPSAIGYVHRVVQEAEMEATHAAAKGGGTEDDPTILAVGECVYRVGRGRPYKLTDEEDTVLQAFLECSVMDFPTLVRISGVERPDRILKGIKSKYPEFSPAIDLAKGKGKGGYHVRIISDTN